MELNSDIVVERKVSHKITMHVSYTEAQEMAIKIDNVNKMLPTADEKLQALVNLLAMVPKDDLAMRRFEDEVRDGYKEYDGH